LVKKVKTYGPRSNVDSLPSNASDDLIGLGDIPIMKVDNHEFITLDHSASGQEGQVVHASS
jgi:hypothetical protein